MKTLTCLLKVVVVCSVIGSTATLANAQATRTWVASSAGGGDDAAPCSRTAPCLTFAGAISKTSEGGEIDVIDPGSYGAVTVTKAITIDGGTGSGWAGILASGTGSAGIIVNVTSGDHADNAKVILRHLTISGAKQAPGNAGDIGIHVIKVSELHIESVNIQYFSSQGINIDGADAINVFINHVSLSHDVTAVRVNTAAGFVATAYLDDVSIQGNNNGVNAVANAFAVIRNSFFSENRGTLGAVKASSGCTVSLENNMFAGNNIAVNVAAGGTANISNNSFYGNVAALSGAGTIATATNSNKFALNTSDGATNATITLK